MKDILIDKFCKSLATLKIKPTDRILVAISGGADSVALAHIFYSINQPIALAHCNFNLRGQESDADETFVRNLAKKMNVPVFSNSFDTEQVAQERGISIEMAARDLRYHWFEQVRITDCYDYTATGHHQNDSIETFFLNLNRGTGIKGLTGIRETNKNIIRPLLNFSREEIEIYINLNNLTFRIDASNFENHYLRNKFRNMVIPVLNEINPLFAQKTIETMEHLKQVYRSFTIRVQEISNQIIVNDGDRTLISQTHVNNLPDKEIIMFEILSVFGFNKSQIADILICNTTQTGQQFYSHTHRLIKDRHNYIILAKSISNKEIYYYNRHEEQKEAPINLVFSEIDATVLTLIKLPSTATFDADLVEFPLSLRRWQQGDSFRPLGMSGFKMLSDFFTDQKFSLDQKESCWLLLSGDDIIWVVNHRIDDRFKITTRTKRALKIEISK